MISASLPHPGDMSCPRQPTPTDQQTDSTGEREIYCGLANGQISAWRVQNGYNSVQNPNLIAF